MPRFAFMPYFPVENFDQIIGRVHFFNFTRFGEKYVRDAEMRGRIDEYCSLYVDSSHQRLSNLTLAVIDEQYDFENLTDEQVTDLDRYSRSLLFCSVIMKSTNSVCVSEQFSAGIQPFLVHNKASNDFITFQTGSILQTLNTQTFDTVRFVRPSFIPSNTLQYRFDERLMTALADMIDSRNPDDVAYFRVLDWVRYAYLNADGYSPESRLVMLAIAFEIFFDLPDFKKADEFAVRLEALLEVDKMDVTGLPQITKSNAKGKDKTNTIYGWWAREFYELRSKIVHGSVVNRQVIRNQKGEQHFVIALRILRFCFHKLLENKGHLVYKVSEIPSFADFSFDRHLAEKGLRAVEKLIY